MNRKTIEQLFIAFGSLILATVILGCAALLVYGFTSDCDDKSSLSAVCVNRD